MADLIPPTLPSPAIPIPNNFPRPPSPATLSQIIHPRDLLASRRNLYTQIQFVPYDASLIYDLVFNQVSASPNPTAGVILPFPRKLNDVQTIVWDEVGITASAAALAAQASFNRWRSGYLAGQIGGVIGSGVSAMTGYTINPMLWMMFRHPNFKEFTLTWTVAANNREESEDIANIITYFKINSLPTMAAGGLLYEYPPIALIRLYPDNNYTFRFKPCAVQAVAVDYTPAGGPSFHKNGAPTIVNITLQVKEIELWTKDNYFL